MDWQFKHFTQEAVFSAGRDSVLAAARAVMAETVGPVEDNPEGFVARGRSARHTLTATGRVEAASTGTKLVIELAVARATWRGFMLVDAGGYYHVQLRRWLSGVGERLGQSPLTRSPLPAQTGCLAGCAVYLVVGTGLAMLALPLDRLVLGGTLPGPAMLAAGFVGLVAGVAAFFYVRNPEAAVWNAVRARVPGRAKK